jgi:hypothetical protein
MFTTDDVNCPISEVSFTEITTVTTGYGLSKSEAFYPSQCTDPKDLSNTRCRKVYIPTDGKVRNIEGNYYKFLFTVKAKGGSELN